MSMIRQAQSRADLRSLSPFQGVDPQSMTVSIMPRQIHGTGYRLPVGLDGI
jgi:hypothetical protein